MMIRKIFIVSFVLLLALLLFVVATAHKSRTKTDGKVADAEGKSVTPKDKSKIKGKVSDAEGKPVTPKGKWQIRGKVVDAEGEPVEGATVAPVPMFITGRRKTNAAGEFEVLWEPQAWMEQQGGIPAIVIRHMERNLAAAMDVEDASKPINVTLKPALSIVGKVVDPEGKPIPRANIMICMVTEIMPSNIGLGRITSDTEGKYEGKVIPPDRTYNIHVQADGYGWEQHEMYTPDMPGRRVDAKTITLPLADLTLSGKVIDTKDKPVANARVRAYGPNQPHLETTSDKDGKFILKGVCKGALRVQVGVGEDSRKSSVLWGGSALAQGGAANIIVVIGEHELVGPARPTPPRSLVGKSLPDVDGFGGDVAKISLEGKRVLVCFWDMNQRPSRHTLRVLASKAELLKKEGVTVLAVHAEPADLAKVKEWAEQYKVPFATGMIEKNPQVTQKAWGVQGLPWLILTDKKHKVVKEGFAAEDLESALSESAAASEK